MNLLQRAKGYVAAKASKIALTVVPLAALAAITVPAHAGVINGATLSPSSCSVVNGSGSCSSDQAKAIGGNTSVNWLELFTDGQIFPDGETNEVTLIVSGGATGLFSTGQNIPVSWDFFISGPSGGTVNWNILFEVFTTSGGFFISPSNTAAITSGGGTEVQGSSSLFVGASTVLGYTLQLDVTNSNLDSYTVNVPGGGTIDFNPTGAAPEPSSVALAVSGLLGLLVRLRKKRS